MHLKLHWKPFSFRLNETLETARGNLKEKEGWLLLIEDLRGKRGWGEVSPLDQSQLAECEKILNHLNEDVTRQELENALTIWPGALAFGIGAALAEIDELIGTKEKGGWLNAPQSAILLSRNQSLKKLNNLLIKQKQSREFPLTLKLKIGIEQQKQEEALVSEILKNLPTNARLRLDANAGLNRFEANKWANQLLHEPKLEWLEQPLATDDVIGLMELAKKIPIALDESLLQKPELRKSWSSWQIRRPSIEGDPRLLLKELQQGIGYRVLSTSFETGIGLRWIHHLAALQKTGPTPTAPGLAPGWCPQSPLFSLDPTLVWQAA